MDLFDAGAEHDRQSHAPLADRMRPTTLDEFMGQRAIIGEGAMLRRALERDEVPSMILWGPPGTGKTTLARIIAHMTKARFIPFSAIDGSVKDIRAIIKDADDQLKYYRKRTVLFVDEIHRFNKSQQDAFLPSVEKGTLTLIGATTENPSFEVNAALLSRCRVFVLEPLSPEDVRTILARAQTMLGAKMNEEALELLAVMANGDARTALNALELAAKTAGNEGITKDMIAESLQRTHTLYDKGGEEHYNIISALHKSMRGHDANAALYWLGRMLEAGEDPLYITRRLIRFASEDIGLADPHALLQAVAADQAAHHMGMPECNVVLAQCVAYLARAPKSNALYIAYGNVAQDIRTLPAEPVPLHLRNAPTPLMKNLGYGKGYKYTPKFTDADEAKQDFLPASLNNKKYLPDDIGKD